MEEEALMRKRNEVLDSLKNRFGERVIKRGRVKNKPSKLSIQARRVCFLSAGFRFSYRSRWPLHVENLAVPWQVLLS
jgi:hypothetical protein